MSKCLSRIYWLAPVLLAVPLLVWSAGETNPVLDQINQALKNPPAENSGAASREGDSSLNSFQSAFKQAGKPTGSQQMGTPPANAGASMPQLNSKKEMRSQAFRALVEQQMPLSPTQIRSLHEFYDQSQRAAATPAGVPPKPVASSLIVNLSPGSAPPAIRLAAGFVSSLVFLDSTGSPWPIESYDLGDPKSFNIQWDKKSNTLMIQAAVLYNYGNLAVKLRGLSTPVMLTLVPGQKVVDYRIDLRVQGLGPNAAAVPMDNGLPEAASNLLLGVLDGVPPAGSKTLKVSGGKAQVWQEGDKLYLRTRYTVLSPGWLAKMSSADGMHAYQLLKTPMVLVSAHGQVTQLKVEGF